ncbi:MAG: DUF1761 domain-containing protein [Leptospiraceae bacterium]|nr:DUF1761 domain-containing protein [Leptospiraceae bacterium]
MKLNFLILAISAFVPLILGFIWYHPKVMGKAWMNASGLKEEDVKGANMLLVLFVSYLFSFFIALALNGIVVHQSHLYSILMNEPGLRETGSELNTYVSAFMAKYGSNFRTFKHGAFHGALSGIFLAMPIIGIGALFERKSFKYIAIHTGYWIISLCLMGGIICQFA